MVIMGQYMHQKQQEIKHIAENKITNIKSGYNGERR